MHCSSAAVNLFSLLLYFTVCKHSNNYGRPATNSKASNDSGERSQLGGHMHHHGIGVVREIAWPLIRSRPIGPEAGHPGPNPGPLLPLPMRPEIAGP